uniref:Rho GTPase activating protein 36 n=1 Tax=Gasterosteus aculeatus aculeatus TaxID=481459 RepID=A0AAQ4RDE5_GASAC
LLLQGKERARIGPQGVRHPALAGHRQRPRSQAAAGRPEGEPAGLPGPGGQRAALPGREEAVLQREPAAGRLLLLLLRGRRGARLAARQLRGAGAAFGGGGQAAVVPGQRGARTEEGRAVRGLHLRPGGESVSPAGGAAALSPGRAGADEVAGRRRRRRVGGADPDQAEPQPHLQAGAPGAGEVLQSHRDPRSSDGRDFPCWQLEEESETAAGGLRQGGGRAAGRGAQRARRGGAAQRVPPGDPRPPAAPGALPGLPARQLAEGSRPASVPAAPPLPAAPLQLRHAAAPPPPAAHRAELRPGQRGHQRRGDSREQDDSCQPGGDLRAQPAAEGEGGDGMGIEDSTAIIGVTLLLVQNHRRLFTVSAELQQEVLMSLIQTDPDIIDYLLRRKLSGSHVTAEAGGESGGRRDTGASLDSVGASSGSLSPLELPSPLFPPDGNSGEGSLTSEVFLNVLKLNQNRKRQDTRYGESPSGKSIRHMRQFHSHHNLLSLAQPSPSAARGGLGSCSGLSGSTDSGVWVRQTPHEEGAKLAPASNFWDFFTGKGSSSETMV